MQKTNINAKDKYIIELQAHPIKDTFLLNDTLKTSS